MLVLIQMLCEWHERFRIIVRTAQKSFLSHYKFNLILCNMINNGKLNFIMHSRKQFNTIVISGVCGFKMLPREQRLFFNV